MKRGRVSSLLVLLVLVAGLLPAAVVAGPPDPGRFESAQEPVGGPRFEASTSGMSGSPSAPPRVDAPVNLTLDDGSLETNIGLNGSGFAFQFLWFNRFTPNPADFPLTLNQIQVLFDATGSSGVNPGDAIDLVVYEDANGNPSDGATWVATVNETVQFADGTNWSVYNLATPLTLNGPGDVLIGVIDRFVVSGVTPANYPAGQDTDSSAGRSWVAAWNADPPDPPVLPPDNMYDIIDNFGYPGNWMIRGYGESAEQPRVVLTPALVEVVGCAGVTQTHDFELYNLSGVDDTFALTYAVPSGNGMLTGPGTLFVADGTTETFAVELLPDQCQFAGTEVIGTIDASGSTTYTAQAIITKTITLGMDTWLPAADTPQGTAYHAVAYYDGAIYHIGGGPTRWNPARQVYRLDIALGSWTAVTPMPTGAYAMDAETIGDLIYVPGGSDDVSGAADWLSGGTFLDSLQIYDPVADSWSTGAAMPTPLAGASAAAYGGLLYVVGGLQNNGVATNTLYIYDPSFDSWTVGPSMAMTRSLAAAAAVDGKIYVAGGYVGANGGDRVIGTVEIYDIAGGSWSFGPDLPSASAPYGDGAFKDRYFVVFNGGGVSSTGYYCSQDAFWYDTQFGTWEALPSLNRCLYGSQGAGAGDRFYLVSGRTNEGGWHMAVEVDYLAECPACPESGWLEGYVLDLETGGADPACTGGSVHLDPGNMTVPVGPDGYYWAEVFSGTYTVSGSAPGYSVETAVLDITTGMTTTQDFDLARPVIEIEPTDFISYTAYVGISTTYLLFITNTGHVTLSYEIIEVPPSVFYPLDASGAFLTTWLEGDVEIDPQVLAELDADGTADFFVQMRLQADLSPADGIEDWSARGHYVYDALRAATEAQSPIIAYAQSRGLEYSPRLSNNAVFIKGGTLDDVNALAARGDVKRIRANYIHELDADIQSASPDAWGWNLDVLDPNSDLYGMQAVQAWQDLGILGKGIVVANIDTGAYYTHEALVSHYRGNLGGGTFDHDYNWYMPTYGCGDGTYPCDNDGHGSGTIGIMAGGTADGVEQIGVAPGAQWIACKGCEANSCSDEALTGCADWMVAPCPIGVDPGDPACNPDMRPHVINNSWGSDGCDLWYQPYIVAWRAAGQFPAFSAGNTVGCGTVGSPGDTPEAFGTAAHASDGVNLYAGGPSCHFLSPSCDPSAHEVDPHLNAPSFGRTAGNFPGVYYDLSGTSGASPHTAGCVALIWEANPFLRGDIDTTFTILEQSADRSSTQPWNEGVCGKPACAGADPYPNYEYGWGYLDCYAAVDMALAMRPDMEWVWEEPISGTVDPVDVFVVDVTFLCTETRDYTGTLLIYHNDPCADIVDIPLEVHCTECTAVDILSVTTSITGCIVDFGADLTGTAPFTYSWDFDALGMSTDPTPTVDFGHTGAYPYTLTAGNCAGAYTDVYTGTVTVECAEPLNYIYLPLVFKGFSTP